MLAIKGGNGMDTIQPIDMIELKASLLVEGIRATETALTEVGKKYKEQNHGLFGWDFEDHAELELPDDFLLPDGTVTQFRMNSSSPFCVRADNGALRLFQDDHNICEVEWIRRPAFYDMKDSRNKRMVRIGQIGGEDCLFFCYQNYCSHFARGKQCLFCNLVSTSQTYSSVLKKKDAELIGEVAGAAWAEGMVNHVLLTGGCFAHEKETTVVEGILSAIRKHRKVDRIPGTILPSPAKGDDIKRYFDTGIQAIGYSMEIWDDALYRAICPGKAAGTSHTEFLKAIESAVAVFGEGNVYGVFVMGLEPKDTFLDAVKTLTKMGANVVPFVWSPNPGSRLAGHRAPSGKWFAEVIREAANIVLSGSVPPGTDNHCYRCDGNNLLHDALRERGTI
jgi:biotin synthase-related radical SAM superfamily protein